MSSAGSKTLSSFGGSPANEYANIRAYHLQGEALTTLQQGDWSALGLLMPDAIGQQFTIPFYKGRGLISPMQSVSESVTLHGMDSVLSKSFPFWRNGSRFIGTSGFQWDPTYVPK